MKLVLDRLWRTETKTLGCLYREGHYECFSLEDIVRPIGEKIYGATAIPTGTYKIVLVDSPKFGPDTPSLELVPGFDFIRIHAGTDEDDTVGCILVGDKLAEDFTLRDSRIARDRLRKLIKAAIGRKEEVSIEVKNSPNLDVL